MRESALRDVLRRIEDIFRDVSGSSLDSAARQRIVSALATLASDGNDGILEDSFSEREVTIMFADLRGFTSLSAAHPAGVVLGLLNRCFAVMSEAIVRQGGTIDKFAGDSIMAIFDGHGADRGDAVRRAVRCAVEMQIAMDELNRRHKDGALPPLYMGIGLNSGRVMAGLVGSDLYSAYTVIGEEVNLTSRIEAFSLRGQVLVSEATYALSAAFAATGTPMEVYVKGRSGRIRVREVLGIPSLGLQIPRQEMRRSPRVEVRLQLRWQRVQRKIVLPEKSLATVLDIGYHGVLIDPQADLALMSELKLEIEIPLVGYTAADIYARVVKLVERDGRKLAGMEFTSLSPETNAKLQLFVQMLLQGHEP